LGGRCVHDIKTSSRKLETLAIKEFENILPQQPPDALQKGKLQIIESCTDAAIVSEKYGVASKFRIMGMQIKQWYQSERNV
jgi:hypothetical protein